MDELIRNAIRQTEEDCELTDQEKAAILLRVLTQFLKSTL